MDQESTDIFRREVYHKYERASAFIEEAIKTEDRYLNGDLESYKNYAKFSDDTPSIFNPTTESLELKSIEELVSKIFPVLH